MSQMLPLFEDSLEPVPVTGIPTKTLLLGDLAGPLYDSLSPIHKCEQCDVTFEKMEDLEVGMHLF